MTEKLTHTIVKAAIDALQSGDSETWKELFDPDAVLLDDGHPRDLERVSDEAVGNERLLGAVQTDRNEETAIASSLSDHFGWVFIIAKAGPLSYCQ
jgi:hypothetical protein